LSLKRAALAEPLAVALHGVDRVRGRLSGSKVLVSGAGPIGCLTILALMERGVKEVAVVDLQDNALQLARRCGATAAFKLGSDELPESSSFDITVEAAGAAASLTACIGYTRPGGAVVQVGILPPGALSVELAPLVSKEITLFGSQRFDIEIDEALEVLRRRADAEAIITHAFPLAQVREALEIAGDSAVSSKVVVNVGGLLA
jgi:L-idonate 5-dehydrogenase